MRIKLKFIPDEGPTEVFEAETSDAAIKWLFDHKHQAQRVVPIIGPVTVPVGSAAQSTVLSTLPVRKNWLQNLLGL